MAEHGFQFCTESLEAKIEKQKELPPESLSGMSLQTDLLCLFVNVLISYYMFVFELDEERKDTRLLLGLSLDARARYLAANHRFTGACRDYRHALQICQEEQGESHPQVMTLHTGTYHIIIIIQ